jgi:hypothetical protein
MDHHHHAVCLATGSYPLAFFSRVRSGVSSPSYQYLLFSLMSTSIFLRLTVDKIPWLLYNHYEITVPIPACVGLTYGPLWLNWKQLLYNKNGCFTHKPVLRSDRNFRLRRLKSVPTEFEFSSTELSGRRLQNPLSFRFLSATRRTPHP